MIKKLLGLLGNLQFHVKSLSISHTKGHGSDSMLPWLWLAAVALIQPLAWDPPGAVDVALKSKKKKKKLVFHLGALAFIMVYFYSFQSHFLFFLTFQHFQSSSTPLSPAPYPIHQQILTSFIFTMCPESDHFSHLLCYNPGPSHHHLLPGLFWLLLNLPLCFSSSPCPKLFSTAQPVWPLPPSHFLPLSLHYSALLLSCSCT